MSSSIVIVVFLVVVGVAQVAGVGSRLLRFLGLGETGRESFLVSAAACNLDTVSVLIMQHDLIESL